MKAPLVLRLKKEGHKRIAKAQDLIIQEVYRAFGTGVLHGGTAVWRCYGGNRFSEDVDMYVVRDLEKLQVLFEHLKKRGFSIIKKKVGERAFYSVLELDRVQVRFEALFKRVHGSLKEYESVDGNFFMVYTLTPEELIKEKVEAYLNRRKIRDLYDVFFLLGHVKAIGPVMECLGRLIKQFQQPVDKKELKVLIFEGIIPDDQKLLEYIKRKAG